MQCGKPTLRYRAGQAACTTSMHKQGCTTNMLNKRAQHACVTPCMIPSTTSMQDIKHKTTHNKHACRACMTSAQHHAKHHAQHYRHSVLSTQSTPAAACMVPQILQRSVAEEVEAVGVIIPAVHAAHPEHAVAGLKEGGFQALHPPLPHLHLGVVPEEVARLAQLLHLHTCHVYIDTHMNRHVDIHVDRN